MKTPTKSEIAAASATIAALVGTAITYLPPKSSVDKSAHPARHFKVNAIERFFVSEKEGLSFTAKVIDLDDGNTETFRTFHLSRLA